MKLVIGLILNIILFIFYSLFGMNTINFIYDLILKLSGKPVPFSNDPIHLKIAGITFLIVSLFTLIFRKYFYLNIFKKNILIIDNEFDTGNISFEKTSDKIDKELKNIRKKESKKQKNILKEGDMEIFMGKEIK